MRAKALTTWDELLSWILVHKRTDYFFKQPSRPLTFVNSSKEIIHFDRYYGYFSSYHPIVCKFTKSEEDVSIVLCLLQAIHEQIADSYQKRVATAEVLTKLLAYRDLERGTVIPISSRTTSGKEELVSFQVAALFDLWHGMPAFGLEPIERTDVAPILLIRGTDLSLTSERSWASILSDLDTSGPGLSVFVHAQSKIQQWLERMAKRGTKARVMGTSLGGVLSIYTLIYAHDWVTQDPNNPSVAFSPPGVSKEVLAEWQSIPDNMKPPLDVFVSKGDIVSKFGYLFGNVQELSLPQPVKVLQSHVQLITCQPTFLMISVDTSAENRSR